MNPSLGLFHLKTQGGGWKLFQPPPPRPDAPFRFCEIADPHLPAIFCQPPPHILNVIAIGDIEPQLFDLKSSPEEFGMHKGWGQNFGGAHGGEVKNR